MNSEQQAAKIRQLEAEIELLQLENENNSGWKTRCQEMNTIVELQKTEIKEMNSTVDAAEKLQADYKKLQADHKNLQQRHNELKEIAVKVEAMYDLLKSKLNSQSENEVSYKSSSHRIMFTADCPISVVRKVGLGV
jgi:DNA repair exonuclease SbcCD ATPase subunit